MKRTKDFSDSNWKLKEGEGIWLGRKSTITYMKNKYFKRSIVNETTVYAKLLQLFSKQREESEPDAMALKSVVSCGKIISYTEPRVSRLAPSAGGNAFWQVISN